MKYIGIDLHSDNSFVVVLDEQDKLLYRKRLPNRLAEILLAIERWQGEGSGIAVVRKLPKPVCIKSCSRSAHC